MRTTPPAELTLAFVSELVDDQLSVDAIHRLYRGIDGRRMLAAARRRSFDVAARRTGRAGDAGGDASARGSLCLVDRDGTGRG